MSTSELRQDIVVHARLQGESYLLHSTWGLFSPRQIDDGTELLLDHLDVANDDIALDMGCGYGPLGLCIARQANNGKVHLIDKDYVAVDYSKANAQRNNINNVDVYLSNGFSNVPNELPLSLVVSNLPAKSGNEFFQIAFEDAHARLQPGGRIVVVTINGLRSYIKRTFVDIFGNCKKLKQGQSYTISMAEKAD